MLLLLLLLLSLCVAIVVVVYSFRKCNADSICWIVFDIVIPFDNRLSGPTNDSWNMLIRKQWQILQWPICIIFYFEIGCSVNIQLYRVIFFDGYNRNLAIWFPRQVPSFLKRSMPGFLFLKETPDLDGELNLFLNFFFACCPDGFRFQPTDGPQHSSSTVVEKNISYFIFCTHSVQWQIVAEKKRVKQNQESIHVYLCNCKRIIVVCVITNVTCWRKIDRHGIPYALYKWCFITRIHDYW